MSSNFTPCLIIHTGAFDLPEKYWESYIKGAKVAVKTGYKVLMEGGSAIEAVEAAVIAMENNEVFNCGYGGVLTEELIPELDAFIMEGHTMEIGAVCSVTHIANPISLSLRVLRETPHCLLSGEGAHKFARKIGYPVLDDPKVMISSVAKDKGMLADNYNSGLIKGGFKFPTGHTDLDHDTVGAVALDKHGHLACATSTGGLVAKMKGRVGDTPLPGSGGYANDTAAVSTTGHGEAIMQTCLAREAVYYTEKGSDPLTATQKAIEFMFKKVQGRGGLIMIDKEGRIGHAFNTKIMCWASLKNSELQWGLHPGELLTEKYEP